MFTFARKVASIVPLAVLFPGQAPAAEDISLLKDLTSTVSILGVSCGPVLSAARKAVNDHIVTCQNGNRYRIFVNPQGRVIAEKQ